MKKLIHALLLITSGCTYQWVGAQCTNAGFDIPSVVQIEGYQSPALLNGFGPRTKFLWNIYISALYLPEMSQDPDVILAMKGPKRVSIYFTHNVPKAKLIEGWQDGFINNNSPQQLEQLQERLDVSYKYLRDMIVGDVIYIDQHPEQGSLLWINGELIHAIPGDDYFKAVLKIWLGKKPAQTPLKECLLGLNDTPESP